MLLNAAGPLKAPTEDDPAADGPLEGTAAAEVAAAAAAAAAPWWAPLGDAASNAVKRVVLWFAFQRARQPERIREGGRPAHGAHALPRPGLGWGADSRDPNTAYAGCAAQRPTATPPPSPTLYRQAPSPLQPLVSTTPPVHTHTPIAPSIVLQLVYVNSDSIDEDLVESIRVPATDPNASDGATGRDAGTQPPRAGAPVRRSAAARLRRESLMWRATSRLPGAHPARPPPARPPVFYRINATTRGGKGAPSVNALMRALRGRQLPTLLLWGAKDPVGALWKTWGLAQTQPCSRGGNRPPTCAVWALVPSCPPPSPLGYLRVAPPFGLQPS